MGDVVLGGEGMFFIGWKPMPREGWERSEGRRQSGSLRATSGHASGRDARAPSKAAWECMGEDAHAT